MKIFILAILAGVGYKVGEFLLDFLLSLIPHKKRKNRISYRSYYDQ